MSLIPGVPTPVWASGSTDPSSAVNTALERLAALARGNVLSRTEDTEPASPDDGDAYILPSGATGANWDNFAEDDLVVWLDGAWFVIEPDQATNVVFFVADDEEQVRWDGVEYQVLPGGGGGPTSADQVSYDNSTSGLTATDVQDAIDELSVSPPAESSPVVVLSGTSYDLGDLTAGRWHVFTSGSAVTITVEDNSVTPIAANAEFGLEARGAGGVTLVEDNDADIIAPKGGTIELEQGDFAVLKRTDVDEYKLVGSTVDAP